MAELEKPLDIILGMAELEKLLDSIHHKVKIIEECTFHFPLVKNT